MANHNPTYVAAFKRHMVHSQMPPEPNSDACRYTINIIDDVRIKVYLSPLIDDILDIRWPIPYAGLVKHQNDIKHFNLSDIAAMSHDEFHKMLSDITSALHDVFKAADEIDNAKKNFQASYEIFSNLTF